MSTNLTALKNKGVFELDIGQIAVNCIDTIWNRGLVDRIPDFYTEDFYCEQASPSLNWTGSPNIEAWSGHDGVRAVVTQVREVIPDYTETPQHVVVSGDMVAMRMINRGTHTGQSIGKFPASGRRFEVVDTMFVRFRDGKIAEQWGLFGEYAIAVQLGLIDPPELFE